MALPDIVEAWRARGQVLSVDGNRVFTVDLGPRDAPVVHILHGFPSSTFDWHHVVADLAADHRVVAYDFVGFGLSEKPVDADYSLFTQTDRTERILDLLGVEREVIVAHDLGDTVAAELLHRHTAGTLPLDISGCVLTNGSIFIDLARLTDGQQLLLALPDEPLAESLGSEALRSGLAATFPAGSPGADELDAIVALLEHEGGDLLLPRLIRYITERRRNQERWTAGLVAASPPVAAVWGETDPIAVPAMADRLERLRGNSGNEIEVVRWPGGGHWPPLERPAELAGLIRGWVARWWV
jgi:pimeloyl-ACP methyl ester carboxylesterase